jgi:hypothetical protein
MRKVPEHTIESYFDNHFMLYGRYGFPLIERQDIDLNDLKLIRFSDIIKSETRDTDATVHFFIDDDRFDEIWKNPDAYRAELSQYKQALSPGFSVYADMAGTLQVFNTFRSRWLGAFWQEMGMTVIPTVTWADRMTHDFCFDAIEQGSVVAVSTLGFGGHEWMFMKGFARMCEAWADVRDGVIQNCGINHAPLNINE